MFKLKIDTLQLNYNSSAVNLLCACYSQESHSKSHKKVVQNLLCFSHPEKGSSDEGERFHFFLALRRITAAGTRPCMPGVFLRGVRLMRTRADSYAACMFGGGDPRAGATAAA
jgi:hypothetical protein